MPTTVEVLPPQRSQELFAHVHPPDGRPRHRAGAAGLVELGYAPGQIKTERFGATGGR